MLRRFALLAATAAAVGLAAAPAQAETLNDPTRPPHFGPEARQTRVGGDESVGNVQTVKTLKSGPLVIINGRVVKVGDAIGKARVTRITETELELRRADGVSERIKLHPHVDKQAVAPSARDGEQPFDVSTSED